LSIFEEIFEVLSFIDILIGGFSFYIHSIKIGKVKILKIMNEIVKNKYITDKTKYELIKKLYVVLNIISI
jgi:hypothetical protein